jgi:hypothetical protein
MNGGALAGIFLVIFSLVIVLAGAAIGSIVFALFGLLIMVIGLGLAYRGLKCPSCGAFLSVHPIEPTSRRYESYGVVTRVDTSTGYIGEEEMDQTTYREERAPIVATTVREQTQCRSCGQIWITSERTYEEEDFSRA